MSSHIARISLIAWCVSLATLGAILASQSAIADPPEQPPGWEAFRDAVDCLAEKGDRKRAAQMFDEVARGFPESDYSHRSQELSKLLDAMVVEDRAWVEPKDPHLLPLPDRIAYHIHHLRDVHVRQLFQPGACNVLHTLDRDQYNAAVELKKIGEPAVPALAALLLDRRPIRSFGYWRSFHPSRTVLRYQDAAYQILESMNELSGVVDATYFSQAPEKDQRDIYKTTREWAEN